MISQIKWTDMSFAFDIPPGKYPALIERLSGTPARLEEKVQDMPFLILTQPFENGWSIQQHIGHLADLEELLMQRLDDFEASKDTLTTADMTNRKTEEAEHNLKDINSLLKTFRTARHVTMQRLLRYDEEMTERVSIHPRLEQTMYITDLVHFFAEHDDHHLAMISKIQRELL
ncbi:MAG: DinB family protein [Chitinophagales bacterium]|nr:DinB family protein [Chitinophagales bacterium]